jgi:DNA processing protein
MSKSTDLSQREALMVLNGLPTMGPITLNRLLEAFGGDPVAVLGAGAAELKSVKGVGPAVAEAIRRWDELFPLQRELNSLQEAGAKFVTTGDPMYPPLLREIHDPPIGLYWRGEYSIKGPAIAVVGSRRTTLYGQAVAKQLGSELARLGFCVVSGLARGIDTAAHEGALSVQGATIAVLGCGLDIIYPPENLDLYRRIAATGAVLSEFPFGRRADRQSFPMRNRVVAGICEALIVVESDENGGAMITARFAAEQGRTVFAVPGRIDQPTSRGCHLLIREGATLLSSVEDVLQELNYLQGLRPTAIPPKDNGGTLQPNLDGAEGLVFSCFRGGGILHPDAIGGLTGLSAAELSASLMMLELKRLVRKRSDGCFEAASA